MSRKKPSHLSHEKPFDNFLQPSAIKQRWFGYRAGAEPGPRRLRGSPGSALSVISSRRRREISITSLSASSSADRPSGLNLSRSNTIRSSSRAFDISALPGTVRFESRPKSRPSARALTVMPRKAGTGRDTEDVHTSSKRAALRSNAWPTISLIAWSSCRRARTISSMVSS